MSSALASSAGASSALASSAGASSALASSAGASSALASSVGASSALASSASFFGFAFIGLLRVFFGSTSKFSNSRLILSLVCAPLDNQSLILSKSKFTLLLSSLLRRGL